MEQLIFSSGPSFSETSFVAHRPRDRKIDDREKSWTRLRLSKISYHFMLIN